MASWNKCHPYESSLSDDWVERATKSTRMKWIERTLNPTLIGSSLFFSFLRSIFTFHVWLNAIECNNRTNSRDLEWRQMVCIGFRNLSAGGRASEVKRILPFCIQWQYWMGNTSQWKNTWGVHAMPRVTENAHTQITRIINNPDANNENIFRVNCMHTYIFHWCATRFILE